MDPSLIEMKEGEYLWPIVTRFLPTFHRTPEVATDRNTIVFRLQVACTRNKNAVQGETDPQKLYQTPDGKDT